mgnify:CR=1 FL=1
MRPFAFKALRFLPRHQRDGRLLAEAAQPFEDVLAVWRRFRCEKGVHGSVVPQRPGQGACVDAVEARNSVSF